MKKLVFLTVCLLAFSANSFAQKFSGEKGVSSVGLILGHAVANKAPAIGVDYRYNIMDKVRLAPSFLYTLENNNYNTWYTNADAHYLTRITKDVTLYPLGGLGVSVWRFNNKIPGSLEDLFHDDSETKVRIGLNLGFGGEMRLSKDMIVGAEFRYNMTTERAYDQAMILIRAAYYF